MTDISPTAAIEKLAHDAWWKSLKNGPVDAFDDRPLAVQKAWRCAANAVRDAVSKWESIETAPKDGTEVMLSTPRLKRPVAARWHRAVGDGW